MKYKLVLENGREFTGLNFGAKEPVIGEIFFSTSMVGYQDILSDPSYYGKIACMTYPLIGNYGLTDEDYDFKNIHVRGYVVKEYNDLPSNFRATRTLNDAMEENKVIGLSDVDTREITKLIRENGVMNACITDDPAKVDMDALKAFEIKDAVKSVAATEKKVIDTADASYSVALLDCGAGANAIDKLTSKGCSVTVYPYNTSADEILAAGHDGVVVSNGPGNPAENTEIIAEVAKILGNKPVFGFGLGHQIMALAKGAATEKMKFGHRGGSVPVRNMADGKVFATHQNHGYTVKDVPADAEIAFTNVSDGTIEGLEYKTLKAFSIQFTPDCFSATVDTDKIYDKFINLMGGDK